jgi:hypothetical protein
MDESLINRSQMLEIAGEHRLFVSNSTIHRWANSPKFPRAVGKDGKYLLYRKPEFVAFLKWRLREIEEIH